MPEVHYLPDDRTIEAGSDETLLAAAQRVGIPHVAACGGEGRCSTCRVLVVEGSENLSRRTAAAADLVYPLGFGDDLRLACQTRAAGPVTVRRLVIDADDQRLVDQRRGDSAGRRIGVERPVSIMVADIRGFTAFSEKVLPYDVIHVLNRFYRLADMVVSEYGGRIGTYTGDGFVAVFDFGEITGSTVRALGAAQGLLVGVDDLQPYVMDQYGASFGVSVGIHSGLAVLGAIGAGSSRVVTAIGDAVNTAARVEHANRRFGTRLLLSDEARQALGDTVAAEPQDPVELDGKTGRYVLHAVKEEM